MGEPVRYIERIRELYQRLGYPVYRWVHNETAPPWTPVTKPLKQCRLMLIASGGIYRAGQVAFHYKDDTSYRAIPTDVAMSELRATHFAYDTTNARRDLNCIFPLETLRRLVAEGFLGGLTAHAYTFMGGIYSARRVSTELAPALVARAREEKADLALLVPA
jgi:D-proline reductase (dithiol) PrdB